MSLWKEPKYVASLVAPTLADGKAVIAGDTWVLGAAVKLMDANTASSSFIITEVFLEDAFEGVL